MDSKGFIKEKLEKLSLTFPDITIKYAFNEYAETHIVQLTPRDEYYNNEDLDNHWLDISAEFMWKFPTENISFISDDSTLKITNPELEFNSFVANCGVGIDWMALFSEHFVKNHIHAISNFVIPSTLNINNVARPMQVFSDLSSMYFHPGRINYQAIGVDLANCINVSNVHYSQSENEQKKTTKEDSRLKAA